MILKVKKIDGRAVLPTYQTPGSAGLDLSVLLDKAKTLADNEYFMFSTGLAVEIPPGYVGLLFVRSSVGTKLGLRLANSVGVIDSDYRGEVRIAIHNISGKEVVVENGQKLAQLVIMPAMQYELIEVDELQDTERGAGGFGSTDRRGDL